MFGDPWSLDVIITAPPFGHVARVLTVGDRLVAVRLPFRCLFEAVERDCPRSSRRRADRDTRVAVVAFPLGPLVRLPCLFPRHRGVWIGDTKKPLLGERLSALPVARSGRGTLIPTAALHSPVQSDDPTTVRHVVVHLDDVVTALEANARRDEGAVLRVTPPFSGRMRARLHLAGRESEYDDPAPLHVDPASLVPDAPPFPDPDDTEDALRSAPDTEYTPERHRLAHADAVERWRKTVRESVTERATVETPAGPHEVEVATLD